MAKCQEFLLTSSISQTFSGLYQISYFDKIAKHLNSFKTVQWFKDIYVLIFKMKNHLWKETMSAVDKGRTNLKQMRPNWIAYISPGDNISA